MSNEKPENIDEYKNWLKEKHTIEITNRTEAHYYAVVNKIKSDFEKSKFWMQLNEQLTIYNQEYLLKTSYSLFLPDLKCVLNIKPFESLLIKTYRKNIIENNKWPDEPENGWILPNNWYCRINDIIRTLLIVKYLDGMDFIINKINLHCEQFQKECETFYEAREEGYYAVHIYTKEEFEIPKVNWDTEIVKISIEIQITTQLQEVIRRLLHKYYEEKRKTVIKEQDTMWQWNYRSDEFIANYLGHILHYVEGMIVEIRDKQTGG
jgi:hypothetical protein